MAEQTNENTRKVRYDAFIYDYQFNRKISIGKFMLSTQPLILLVVILTTFYYSSLEGVEYSKYARVIGFLVIAYLIKSYLGSTLRYSSKLTMINKNEWRDAKSKAIMVLSKISWANKNTYEYKKMEGVGNNKDEENK